MKKVAARLENEDRLRHAEMQKDGGSGEVDSERGRLLDDDSASASGSH